MYDATKCHVRWAAFAGMLVAALAGAVPAPAGEDEPRSKAQGELLVIGPIPLRKLYENIKTPAGKKVRDAIPKWGGPDDKAICESLAGCKIYVLDRRVSTPKGEWAFVDRHSGYPKILAEGRFSFDLKDKKGEDFRIQIEEVSIGAMETVSKREQSGRGSPYRAMDLIVGVATTPFLLSKPEAGVRVYGSKFNFTAPLDYDVNGAYWVTERAEEKGK